MPMPQDEFSLMETVRDSTKFADKIDQLLTAKKDADKAKKDAIDAVAEFRKQKDNTDNYVNGRKAELQAKQQEHDKAAEEAAKRIELGRQQMVEVMRIKELNESRTIQLDALESELAQRERTVSATEKSLNVLDAALEKKRLLIVRQQAHIAAMPQS